jgi:hypothetical protein
MRFKIIGAALAALFLGTAPASADIRDLEGAWDNKSARAGNVTEMDIVWNNGNWRVKARAYCGQRPCDLGEAVGYTMVPLGSSRVQDASGVSAGFQNSDASRHLIIQVISGNRLEVTNIQSWKDGRPASVSKEVFARSGRGPGGGGNAGEVKPDCENVAGLTVRYTNGKWTLADGNKTVALFDTPDQAGYARWVIQSHGLTRKCTIKQAAFEFWTASNGSFPNRQIAGEYCNRVGGDFKVDKAAGVWRVMAGRQVLYQANTEGLARSVVRALKDGNAQSQCFIGAPGRGVTYFKR